MIGRHRPGAGFVILLVTGLATVAFFAWGLRTPPLERIWQMQIELALGVRKPLSPIERQLLASALLENPGLAEGMLGDQRFGLVSANHDGLVENGCAYLVARKVKEGKAKGKRAVEIAAADGRGDDPLPIEITTGGSVTRGELRAGTPFLWPLPEDRPFPALVEVCFEPKAASKKKAARDRSGILVRTRELP